MKCFVRSCSSDFNCKPNIAPGWVSKHRFPKHAALRNRWLEAISNAENVSINIDSINFKSVRVCSKHFTRSSYYYRGNKLYLTDDAVPTVFNDCQKPDSDLSKPADCLQQIGVPEAVQKSMPTVGHDNCEEHSEKTPEISVAVGQKMIRCVVDGCEERTRSFRGITTHRFPLETVQCEAWVKFSANHYLAKQYALKGPLGVRNWGICSQHFEPECYRQMENKKRGLKPGSLPTLPQAVDGHVEKFLKAGRGIAIRRKTVNLGRNYLYKSSQHTQTEDVGPQPASVSIPVEQSDCCRLCFTTENLEPLCSGTMVVRDELLDKIYICTGILIIPKPKKFIYICKNCAKTIRNFHLYRQQICSNNRMLVASQEKNTSTAEELSSHNHSPSWEPETYIPNSTLLVRRILPTKMGDDSTQEVKDEITIDIPDGDELEAVDPLENLDRPHPNREREASVELELDFLEEDDANIPTCIEPSNDSIESDDSLEADSCWKCWHCDTTFVFKFECAKHLLQVHQEDVSIIGKRLELDELNRNMLEMMNQGRKRKMID
ncbi:uncharacterized protein LOC129764080 isoform X2 [Toxorhynchites rutilus septentrionalis]|uniref:uncharacterized protein LOC129764080 isoform X2 n=1 Tax=Toxorhynchites rutilus septentrionalis TaxID=329112 RepID=UPI00247AC859|nr:uncharacterized protein LOC129764080 isoform X2 [Toxorhynchites rutilus septentrionalis]